MCVCVCQGGGACGHTDDSSSVLLTGRKTPSICLQLPQLRAHDLHRHTESNAPRGAEEKPEGPLSPSGIQHAVRDPGGDEAELKSNSGLCLRGNDAAIVTVGCLVCFKGDHVK